MVMKRKKLPQLFSSANSISRVQRPRGAGDSSFIRGVITIAVMRELRFRSRRVLHPDTETVKLSEIEGVFPSGCTFWQTEAAGSQSKKCSECSKK